MSTRPEATTPPCPNPETLGKLLRDELSLTQARSVEEHVGACRGCQQMLQQLVGSLPNPLSPLTRPHTEAADDEPPGLPGYAAVGRIDAGGMGVVWRVRDLEFHRPLAVKVIKSALCDHPAAARRFLAEARITG